MSGVENRWRRRTTWFATMLVALSAAVVGASFDVAAAAEVCEEPTRIFAQRIADGRLVEIPGCSRPTRLGPDQLVGDDDWRRYRRITAVVAGDAVVFYAITADGELWWYRQAGPGAPLTDPVRLAAHVDWSASISLIVPAAGYLHTQDGETVHTWSHPAWAVGGTDLTQLDPLLTDVEGPALSAVHWGRFGEGIWGRTHFRVWRNGGYPTTEDHSDVWYISGQVLAAVTGVTGAEPDLYGLDGNGAVVWLRQDLYFEDPARCPLADRRRWLSAAHSPGRGFARVIAPARPMEDGGQGLAEAVVVRACREELDDGPHPYEWH
jgi:hypothetical protein